MDLETFLNNQVKAARSDTLKRTNQMTLGELIAKLEGIPTKDDEPYVTFDFEYAFPTSVDSWRGSYDELAIGFAFSGYGPVGQSEIEPPKLSDFIKLLKSAIGKEFEGWKGGEYIMSKTTPIWVSNPGNSGNTAITEVVDNGYQVILMTGYCEY